MNKSDPVFDLMDALKSPILTFSQSWADTLPKRLLDIITMSRMVALMTHEEIATYPEAYAYFMTRTMEAPMQDEWVDIYLHVSCTVCEQYWKEDHWDELQAMRTLPEYHTSLLKGLRVRIYEQRRKILKSRLKGLKTKVQKEPEEKKVEIVQLSLF